MFGGGAQGKAAANDLRQMIDILDKEYGKLISDSQQFIMRELILQGGAAGAAGAFVIGGGSIVALCIVTWFRWIFIIKSKGIKVNA